jgi:hypothetical protein
VIYICIPALNEARTVGVLLWKIRQVMEEFPRDYQVLVLDDGSTDDTRAVLEPYARVLPVTVLRHERTLGYGAALERLVREAAHRSTHPKRDAVVVFQADFTESPEDIPLLLRKLEGGADLVAGVVTDPAGELPRPVRWARRGLPWMLARARLPKEVRDPLSGFRAYRVAVLRRALQDAAGALISGHGWAANAELLLRVAPHLRRVEEAEIRLRYHRRERATRFSAWTAAREMWEMVRRSPRAAPRPPASLPGTDSDAGELPAPSRPPQPETAAVCGAGVRGPRDPRAGRGERSARPERGDRADRGPRAGRPERAERPERTDLSERTDRPERVERPGHTDRPDRPERPARPERAPRGRRGGRGKQREPAAEAAAVAGQAGDTVAGGVEAASTPAEPAVEGAAPTRRRRSSRGRKRGGRRAGGSTPEAGAEAGSAAGDRGENAGASTAAPDTAPQAQPGEGGGEGAAAPRKRAPRPRRPRKPRAAAGGDGAGGDSSSASAPATGGNEAAAAPARPAEASPGPVGE